MSLPSSDPFCTEAAQALYSVLNRRKQCIVLAESCTAGLAAASLGRLPGISRWLAGSAVVYQEQTKVRWLDVSEDLLAAQGAVCQATAEQMATGVLNITPQADVAVAITGHLGPDAPENLDGLVWCAVAIRTGDTNHVRAKRLPVDSGQEVPHTAGDTDRRHHRQIAAVREALRFCRDRLLEQEH